MLFHQENYTSATRPDYTRPLVSEEELLDFLLDTHSYSHRPQQVHLIQTHGAYILVASPYVYKVKKPVNLGFLDFSTLGKRLHFLKRELLLNKRLCPEIYLGIVPIFLKKGTLTFSGDDNIVEYALKMRELPSQYFIKERLKKGDFGYEEIDRIAEKLKMFYKYQIPKEKIVTWGRIEQLKISTDENFRQIEPYIDRTLSQQAFDTIRYYTDQFYIHKASLLSSRADDGWIRDCHGDLHLDHIHLSPTSVCIYDCIEFNDRFRYIDVANDIAFLAMDLDFHGHPHFSKFLVDRMAGLLGDPDMHRVMDFYKCYRAVVRGKVESLRSSEHEIPDAERKQSRELAQHYVRMALQYAAVGSKPTVLVVMGNVATGKSTLATTLSQELGWEVVSSDKIRKELFGIPLHERSNDHIRSRLYTDFMKQKVYGQLLDYAVNKACKGKDMILDATFSSRANRTRLRKQLKLLGASYCFIETQASDKTVQQRLREREKDSPVSDARIEDLELMKRLYEPPTELNSQETIVADTQEGVDTVGQVFKDLVLIHLLNDYFEPKHEAYRCSRDKP